MFNQALSSIKNSGVNSNNLGFQRGRFGSSKLHLVSEGNLVKELSLDEAEQQLKSFNNFVVSGEMTYEQYFNTIGKNNTVLRDYIATTDKQSQSVQGLVKASQEARAVQLAHNEAIRAQTFSAKAGTVALKALSIAGNMIVMWAVSKAISLASSAWDHFNITVKEVQENIDTLTSNIESLNAEIDGLSGKSNLTIAEQERLKYLETRIDLEERLLKIENTRLAQEQIGKSTKFTDWFDDDSYVKKATKEFGVYALDDYYLSNPWFNTSLFSIIGDAYAYYNGAEAVIRKGNEQYEELKYLTEKYETLIRHRDAFDIGSRDWQAGDERVVRTSREINAYRKKNHI